MLATVLIMSPVIMAYAVYGMIEKDQAWHLAGAQQRSQLPEPC